MCSTAFCLPLLITAPNHSVWLSGTTLGSTLWFPGLSYLPSGIRAGQPLDVTGRTVLAHFTDEEPAQGSGVGPAGGRAGSKIQAVWEVEALPLQPAMCPRVQTVYVEGSGEPSWGAKKFSKGWDRGRYE